MCCTWLTVQRLESALVSTIDSRVAPTRGTYRKALIFAPAGCEAQYVPHTSNTYIHESDPVAWSSKYPPSKYSKESVGGALAMAMWDFDRLLLLITPTEQGTNAEEILLMLTY